MIFFFTMDDTLSFWATDWRPPNPFSLAVNCWLLENSKKEVFQDQIC